MSDQDNYLYGDDPKARIARWARSLKYFRFVRSGGGMSGGGDNLLLAVRVVSQEDLEDVFAWLEAPLRPYLPDPAEFGGNGQIRFIAGPSADPASVQALSPALGLIRIGAATIYAYYVCGTLELRIADDAEPWRVTDAAVDAARAIEPRIAGFAHRLIDPPQNDPLCVCPKFHPEIWESPAERELRIARQISRRRRRKALWWILAACLAFSFGLRWLTGGD